MEYLVIAILGLISSFFFSGAETAFVSVNKVKVELWDRQNIKGSHLIKDFVVHPEKFLLTTLVGTNISNITSVTFSTIYFTNQLKWNPTLTWFVVSGTILFLGEIFPKYLFRSYADYFVRRIALPLGIAYYVFYILILVVGKISSIFLRIVGVGDHVVTDFFSKKDLEILLKETGETVEISEEADKIILTKLLEFKNIKVKDAMIPRTDIVAAEVKTTITQLKRLFIKSGRTRIPIYKDKLDNIIGVAYVKDLFTNPKTVKEILHTVIFVPEYKSAGDLLQEFRQKSQSIAIVVDEYGGTSGLVTTEDLIEVLFGEIQDEYDQEKKYIIPVDERTFKVHARTEIEEFNKELGISLPEGDYETVGGFLLHQLGHIPKREEEYEYKHLKFIVTKATRKNIQWLKVIKMS